jgi:uncharacterized integral membrane protein
MKFIVWLIRVLVFVLLLVLALATQTATLNFAAGYAWQAPLILIGLAFFVVGLLAGLLSALPSIFRLRLENGRLKRDLRAARETRRSSTSRRCRPSFNTDAARISRGFRLCFDISHGSGFLVVARDSRRVRARMGGVTL